MDNSFSPELADTELYDFLVNAPKKFRENERIKKFQLKNGDFIHCVLWNYHFYITGTDIVKILIYRFQIENRLIPTLKKFEEGIFSDLRNLKPGIDATLEEPRSEFLEFLYKNGCIRTQKKQKVFFWYSVPHDVLFCDAVERDLRRENQSQMLYFHSNRGYNNGVNGNGEVRKRTRKITFDSGFKSFDKSRNKDSLRQTLFGDFSEPETYQGTPQAPKRKVIPKFTNKTNFNNDSGLSNIISSRNKINQQGQDYLNFYNTPFYNFQQHNVFSTLGSDLNYDGMNINDNNAQVSMISKPEDKKVKNKEIADLEILIDSHLSEPEFLLKNDDHESDQ
ncbi:STE12 [Hepatospora eriocheir]|uniref:STE12 n=1 Tax=Hepatospora eriocheir TaxID=1081669 RepID=A0A1X0Q9W0_9MICR|nr:STE12 [Hepatospora eriocheir]